MLVFFVSFRFCRMISVDNPHEARPQVRSETPMSAQHAGRVSSNSGQLLDRPLPLCGLRGRFSDRPGRSPPAPPKLPSPTSRNLATANSSLATLSSAMVASLSRARHSFESVFGKKGRDKGHTPTSLCRLTVAPDRVVGDGGATQETGVNMASSDTLLDHPLRRAVQPRAQLLCMPAGCSTGKAGIWPIQAKFGQNSIGAGQFRAMFC